MNMVSEKLTQGELFIHFISALHCFPRPFHRHDCSQHLWAGNWAIPGEL